MKLIGINDIKIKTFVEIDSTSTFLKRNSEELSDLTVAFASFQVSGHGRINRQWMATKCESILFSILIKNKKIIKNFAKLSLLTANVVFKLFSRYTKGVSIKWPNDVYINGKKACGILLESTSNEEGISSLVLGVGININTSSFTDELKDIATSLFLETGKKYDLESMKKEFLDLLIEGLNEILKDDDSYLDNIRKYNYLLNKEVYALINGEKVVATVLDINDDTSLLVTYQNKNYNLTVGEVVKK